VPSRAKARQLIPSDQVRLNRPGKDNGAGVANWESPPVATASDNKSMQFPRIQKSDLNLLLSFKTLIEQRNITHAGQQLGLTQTAMSRHFDRLQDMLGDDILVRRSNNYIPTRRALDVYSQLSCLFPKIEGLLRGSEFNPAEATDSFRIAATDYTALLIIPKLFNAISRMAPGIKLRVSVLEPDVVARLESNAIDLALKMGEAPSTLQSELIYEDSVVCLVRKGHPIDNRPLTLKRYVEMEHVRIWPWPTHSTSVDRALERAGYHRNVRVVVPYFSAVLPLLEGSDMVATAPRAIAKKLPGNQRFRILRLPIEPNHITVFQVWHPRSDSDPAHMWLREFVKKSVGM
jgi:DNA-binding transcriptional LysR family regulator